MRGNREGEGHKGKEGRGGKGEKRGKRVLLSEASVGAFKDFLESFSDLEIEPDKNIGDAWLLKHFQTHLSSKIKIN